MHSLKQLWNRMLFMSKDKLKEIDRLEKVIDHSFSFDLEKLNFTEELALIRIIEEVGRIAKDLVR